VDRVLVLLVVVWHSGTELVSINEVNLRQAQLVLGWVTASRFNSWCRTFTSICYVTSHPGKLSLAMPLWVGTMSTSQRAVTSCGGRYNYVIPLLHLGHIRVLLRCSLLHDKVLYKFTLLYFTLLMNVLVAFKI